MEQQAAIHRKRLVIIISLIAIVALGIIAFLTMKKAADIEKRVNVANQPRRIIINNDGNESPSAPVTAESFLAERTTGLAGTHVDAVFYCDGVFNLYTHQSQLTEHQGEKGKGINKQWLVEFNNQGLDTLQLQVDAARKAGREIFWSMRMNDTHDSAPGGAALMSDWKKQNRHLLMAAEKTDFPFGELGNGLSVWTALDYSHEEVRDRVLAIIEDVVMQYDLDGIELDFMRYPLFFKSQVLGEPVTDAECDLMTDLLKRIRKTVDKVAAKRGKPFLIAVRVTDSVGYNKALGLDLEEWLDDELIDMIAAGWWFQLQPWERIVEFAKPYNVPVYACLSTARLPDDRREQDYNIWRGEAERAWKIGVAGIYLYGIHDPANPLLTQMGDPEALSKLPSSPRYQLNRLQSKNIEAVSRVVKGGETFFSEKILENWLYPHPKIPGKEIKLN